MVDQRMCNCGLNPGDVCDDSCDHTAQVFQFPEPDDIYRLYRPEWVQVYRSVQTGNAGRREMEAHFVAKYQGRLWGDDVEFVNSSGVALLRLRLNNLKGEYKTAEYARKVAEGMGWPAYWVVKRNSPADDEMRDYGKKMLPQTRD